MEEICKDKKGEPIVEDTTFGYVIHGGNRRNGTCLYVKGKKDFERLSSPNIFGVEDRGEDNMSDIHRDFTEDIVKGKMGDMR